MIAVAVVAALYQAAFAAAYTSAGHNPVAHNMPFATTGNSSLTSAVQKNLSLKVTNYSDQAAAQNAIGQAKAWGALIAGTGTNTLLVVPSISDLAPYTLGVEFGKAAKSQARSSRPSRTRRRRWPQATRSGWCSRSCSPRCCCSATRWQRC